MTRLDQWWQQDHVLIKILNGTASSNELSEYGRFFESSVSPLLCQNDYKITSYDIIKAALGKTSCEASDQGYITEKCYLLEEIITSFKIMLVLVNAQVFNNCFSATSKSVRSEAERMLAAADPCEAMKIVEDYLALYGHSFNLQRIRRVKI